MMRAQVTDARSLVRVLLLVAAAYGVIGAVGYATRWCPAGTDAAAEPHCLVQPYLQRYFGIHPRLTRALPKQEELRFYRN